MILNRLTRRQALRAGIAATAAIVTGPVLQKRAHPAYAETADAVVIGSGFGGGVAALRLAQAGIQTVVLERGKRWPITPEGNTFATFRKPDGRAWWMRSRGFFEGVVGLEPPTIDVYTGVLDLVQGNGIAVLRGAGVGGGSLIYNAIQYQPTRENFNRVFPAGVDYDELERVYYPRVRAIVKADKVPPDILASKYYQSTRVFMQAAAAAGLPARLYDVAVDWDVVRDEIAGKRVLSAAAGEVWYGVNSGAKNSVDRNYLAQAEASPKVSVLPLHEVQSISAKPEGGFQVFANQIDESGAIVSRKTFDCRYLFLAAGSLGTSELLVRARARGDMPFLNDEVGRNWGNNGDVFHFWSDLPSANSGEGGPSAAIVEHFNNPVAPFVVENVPLWLAGDTSIFCLALGVGGSGGTFDYDPTSNKVTLNFPTNDAAAQRLLASANATFDVLNPTRKLPPSAAVCPHPLGGAALGKATDLYGRVRGYRGLYVVDGALIPGSAGVANPSLTIAALAERAMDNIMPELIA